MSNSKSNSLNWFETRMIWENLIMMIDDFKEFINFINLEILEMMDFWKNFSDWYKEGLAKSKTTPKTLRRRKNG